MQVNEKDESDTCPAISNKRRRIPRKRGQNKSAGASVTNSKADIVKTTEYKPSTLFVTAIKGKSEFPDDITETDLKQHFSKYKTYIVNATIARDWKGNPKGYGFITFSTCEVAETVRKAFHGTRIHQCSIRLHHKRFAPMSKPSEPSFISDLPMESGSVSDVLSQPCSPSTDDQKGIKGIATAVPTFRDKHCQTLLVKGINVSFPDSIRDEELEKHFSAFSHDIIKAYIVRNPQTQQSQGYGLVTFRSFQSANKAQKKYNGTYLIVCKKYQLDVSHIRECMPAALEQPSVLDKGVPLIESKSLLPSQRPMSTKQSKSDHSNTTPAMSKQRRSIVVVDNIPDYLTIENIQTITDCPGTHVTIEGDQTRHAIIALPKDVDAYSICCKWDGKVFLGEPIHAYIVEDEQEKQNRPSSSVKHLQLTDDLGLNSGTSSKHPRQRRERRRKDNVKLHPSVAVKCSNPDEHEINEHIICEDRLPSDALKSFTHGKYKQSSRLLPNKSEILHGPNSDISEQTLREPVTSLDLTEVRNEYYQSCTREVECDQIAGYQSNRVHLESINSTDQELLHQPWNLTNQGASSVGNSSQTLPVTSCSSTKQTPTEQIIGNETKNSTLPTNAVFLVNCETDKSKFCKYMHHHLQDVTVKFEVKEIKFNQEKGTSEVMVQFPNLDVANFALMQLQEHSDLTGEICEPEKSAVEILFKEKLAEFKESIQKKSQLFKAKHKNKMDKLVKERKELILPQNCPINLFQDVTTKRDVLNQAIVECERQESEFTMYCTCLKTELSKLEGEAKLPTGDSTQIQLSEQSLNEELSKLRKKFGIECNRLERALPMYAYRSEIIKVIQAPDNQVIILIGETGSGKSTQLVQYIYECGLAENGTIVCTQPRKVAAVSLAKHVSTEMGVALGQSLGYKTGLRGMSSHKTKVFYMTDHTLLNECIADPTFSKYSCLIVDEAHERSLSTDLLLAFIKKCLPKRPDLKVIITSATIDPEIFDNYFGGGCPIIKVPGRTYPVDIIWNPLKSDKSPLQSNYISDAVNIACQLHESEPAGDILIFLTSAAEIEKACQSTTNRVGRSAIVLPLHGKLPPGEQQKVFQEDDLRKIVFATNVAETSVTIPGVKYIIDTGLAKELCFDPTKNMNSLEVRIISKSSAEQRKGRAGRISAGKCYRLYSDVLYNEMPDKSLPEILRVTLETTALKLHEFGITDVLGFDFVEEPDRVALEKAVENLIFLEAIRDGHLTEVGKKMAALPIDPHLSRIILDGITWGVGLEAAVSAAISTLAGSVFFRAGTDEMKQESDMKTITFCHPAGDQMTYLYAYFQWASQEHANQNQWCVEHFINAKSMRMVREVVKEFRDILRINFNIILEDRPFNPEIAEEVLPKLYFDTFIRNICVFLGHERVGYLNSNLPDERLFIFYGSPLRQLNVVPRFLVYEKTLVTTQHFLLQALPIKEEWIYEAVESGRLPCHPSETDLYRRLCVVPVVVSNLGRFSLKQLQKQWKNNSRPVIDSIMPEQEMDYDYKQGTVKVFVPTCHQSVISEHLLAEVSRIKNYLKEEVCEKGATKDDDNVRVVLKLGATVKHLLMPDQYRTVLVKGISDSALREEIEMALKCFGAIERVYSKDYKSNHQLFVTFLNPDSACEVVGSLSSQIQLPDDVAVLPYTPYKRPHDNLSTFTLHVEWCRRARKKHAFVNFENEEDFYIAVQRLCIPHRAGYFLSSMKFRPSKDGGSQLFVSNVDLYITEDQIKQAIQPYIPEISEDKFEVKIGYEKSFETSQKMLKDLKEELNGLVAQHATTGKYRIFMNQPKNYFKAYKAHIKFDSPDEGYTSLKHLQCASINGKLLSVKSELSSIVRYSSKVYSAVEKSVQEVTSEINSRYKSVRVNHGQQDDKGQIIVRISSENVKTFIIAKHALSTVILPDVINCHNPAIREFIRTANCKRALEKIETDTSTFIRVDVSRATISIYGNESNRTRAKIEFNKCLSFLDDGTKCFEIRLKEAGKPPGLMKHLVSLFGPGLQQLQERQGVTTIRLDPRRQMVTMFATQDVYDFLVSKVNEFTKSLNSNFLLSVHHHRLDEIECCVCFAVITNPVEIFRLESCGHTYCIDCIKTQVAPSTVEFPIECAADDCSEPIVWRDIYSLSELTGFNIRHMVNASVRSYVAANQDKVRNCPTPDCSTIYAVTKDGKCFFCHQCGAIICTTCHEPYHEGVTCALYQSGKTADKEFEHWLQSDPENRRRCPRCSAPIEKTFGCNHVVCTQCHAHICWFCLDYFGSSTECYNHMRASHKGFGL